MFVRKVGVRLKQGSLKEFARFMEFEILPWLREQEGFQDLITLAEPDGCQVSTLAFWDHELNAESCDGACPEGLKVLEELLDGVPYVKTFNVVGSTLAKLAPAPQSDTGQFSQSPGSATSSFELA